MTERTDVPVTLVYIMKYIDVVTTVLFPFRCTTIPKLWPATSSFLISFTIFGTENRDRIIGIIRNDSDVKLKEGEGEEGRKEKKSQHGSTKKSYPGYRRLLTD